MPFDPREFLEVADSMASQGRSEAALRTAVGRAYYAAFLRARDMLGVRGRRRVKKRVIDELKKQDRHAGDQLDKLEELRDYADYDLNITDPLFSDWNSNWNKARTFATYILRRVP